MSHFELIQKLHVRFLEVREEGTTEDAEQLLVEEDIKYLDEITAKVCPLLDRIDNYEEGLAHVTKMKALTKNSDEAKFEYFVII